MKKAVVFITIDGTHHESRKRAAEWCENRYNERIAKLAHAIVKTDFKYTAVVELLKTEHIQEIFKAALLWEEDANLEVDT